MNSWISSAAHFLLTSWVADAHEDPESGFDADDLAPGPGGDWWGAIPHPEDDPERFGDWGTHQYSWADAYVAAHILAAMLYERGCRIRETWACGLSRGVCPDVWRAFQHDDSVTSVSEHAHLAVGAALGHGTDRPADIGGLPWPDMGDWMAHEPNPFY